MAKKIENKDPFVIYINKRIALNKNCIIAIVGDTGSGKSMAALRMGEVLDRNFCIDRVVFKGHEFLNAIRQDWPSGSVIKFDEGGVDWGARKFMSFLNQALGVALQTVRYKNHIIILTVPDISFIDTQCRKLMHILIKTDNIDYKKGVCVLRPYTLKRHTLYKKDYNPHPIVKIDGTKLKITRLNVKLPSDDLIKAYDKKKIKFTDKTWLEAHSKLVGTNDHSVLSDRERTVYEGYKLGVSNAEMSKKLGVNYQTVLNIRSRIKNKGISIPLKVKKTKVLNNDKH